MEAFGPLQVVGAGLWIGGDAGSTGAIPGIFPWFNPRFELLDDAGRHVVNDLASVHGSPQGAEPGQVLGTYHPAWPRPDKKTGSPEIDRTGE